MGLDMHGYAIVQGGSNDGEEESLTDWRKHNRLHGWMEERWEDKGRPNWDEKEEPLGNFNCIELELTSNDLDVLEADINDKTMPDTGGFFFGDDSFDWDKDDDGNKLSEGDYFYKATDLSFVKKARKAIKEGKKVYYNSWW
jgi:hypothetical protein